MSLPPTQPSRQQRPPIQLRDLDVVERGVSASFLSKLVHKRKLHKTPTRVVAEEYVVPQTAEAQSSLCAVLRKLRPEAVGTPTHFVVHAWSNMFDRLVKALEAVDREFVAQQVARGVSKPARAFFWIDLFSLDQNACLAKYKMPESRLWEVRDETFCDVQKISQKVPRTVVFADPPHDPHVCKRAWCVYESFVAKDPRVVFCPEPPDRPDVLARALTDFERTVEAYTINFSDCQTTHDLDKSWLSQSVVARHPQGDAKLNEDVSEMFLRFIGPTVASYVLKDHIDVSLMSSDDDDDGSRSVDDESVDVYKVQSLQALGNLLERLNETTLAKRVFSKAMACLPELEAEEPVACLSVKHDFACLIAKHFQRFKAAEKLLVEVLDKRTEFLGIQHLATCETRIALARLYKASGRLDEAIDHFRKALTSQERLLGESHRQALVTRNGLALCLQKAGELKEAEDLLVSTFERGVESLGTKSLDVLVWANNLAVLYQDERELSKACKLLKWTLTRSETALGTTHSQTLTTVYNLGSVLWQMGRLRSAEALFRREFAHCKAHQGESHTDTLRSMRNLSRLLKEQGEVEEADRLWTMQEKLAAQAA